MTARWRWARGLDVAANLVCALPIAAVAYKKLAIGGVYWSFSNYYLLGLPGALGLTLALAAAAVERRRFALHAAAGVLGAVCLYATPALDSCMLLTDYDRWIRRGMPTRPLCDQCMDRLAKAACERVGTSRD